MRRKTSRASRRLTLLAVVVAIAGGLLFHRYAVGLANAPRETGPWTTVLVAAGPLPRGAVPEPSDLRAERVPVRHAPPGALTESAAASGRVLLAPLAAGEALTETRLGPRGAGPIASLVPSGLRAVAIATSLPAGAVRPADHVDVLATFGSPQPHAETVLTSAEVLLVLGEDGGPSAAPAGPGLRPAEESGLTLVLLVAPEEAERLAYARAFADLSVAIGGAPEPQFQSRGHQP